MTTFATDSDPTLRDTCSAAKPADKGCALSAPCSSHAMPPRRTTLQLLAAAALLHVALLSMLAGVAFSAGTNNTTGATTNSTIGILVIQDGDCSVTSSSSWYDDDDGKCDLAVHVQDFFDDPEKSKVSTTHTCDS